MAFTFQINDDIKFTRNEVFLKKAEALKPTINTMRVKPISIIELTNDNGKLNGIGTRVVGEINDLNQIFLKRDDKVILDFGDHYVGRFSIKLSHHGSPQDSPLTLRVKYAEVAAELAQESSEYDGWLSKSWIQEEFYHYDELPAVLTKSRRYAFRYVELKVIDTSPKWSVSFSEPELEAQTSADFNEKVELPLGDQQLQSIFDVSVKTLRDCMQDVFEDGPKRDRRLWLGDLRLQALANYATFNNTELVKRCLYLFAAMTAEDGRIVANVFTSPQNIPDDTFLFDYSLFFISTLSDYLVNSEDEEVLGDLLPVAKVQMDIALKSVNELGKFSDQEDYPVFVDWSNDFNKETSGQAIMIYVLKQFIRLLEKSGENSENYQRILNKMLVYTKEKLFDQEQGFFVSGQDREINISSQVWLVLAGVLNVNENAKLMKKMVAELFPVRGIATPYMYHHIAEALFISGLRDEAVDFMKQYWGQMITLGADTYWEAFEPENVNYSPYGSPIVSSYCHAWGCTPAYLIKKYLL
ncbi:family 78 glycoside hydrolase catalytic domain [Ligilactobacillus equi]|uniref:Bacterial alpha-L-rhamnosidase n=1 Tax=Ligilactobacillus equi DPC 6820 TaxID=1392007 RepID=V7HSR0_9LACO|nr:family 78 glycoside hydrolase catalytic domain [Ligilactobacillus equi]ETA73264.1 bacterial alpha-L-rhamnosidase [Ligilactobacillus equi DPC 6820]